MGGQTGGEGGTRDLVPRSQAREPAVITPQTPETPPAENPDEAPPAENHGTAQPVRPLGVTAPESTRVNLARERRVIE